jgi:hypothetical protein
MFEPYNFSDLGVIMANSIDKISNDGKVFVRMLNFSNTPVELSAGTTIGSLKPVDSDSLADSIFRSCVARVTNDDDEPSRIDFNEPSHRIHADKVLKADDKLKMSEFHAN